MYVIGRQCRVCALPSENTQAVAMLTTVAWPRFSSLRSFAIRNVFAGGPVMILSQECHVIRRQPCSTVTSRSTSSSIASLSRPRKFFSVLNASRSLSSIMLAMHQPLRSYLCGCLSIAQWMFIFQTLHKVFGCSSLCLLGDCTLFDGAESLFHSTILRTLTTSNMSTIQINRRDRRTV